MLYGVIYTFLPMLYGVIYTFLPMLYGVIYTFLPMLYGVIYTFLPMLYNNEDTPLTIIRPTKLPPHLRRSESPGSWRDAVAS